MTESFIAILVLSTLVHTCLGDFRACRFIGPSPTGQDDVRLLGNVSSTYTKTSLIECAQKCTEHSNCTAFNMRQAGGACELLEGNPQKLLVGYEKNSKYFTVRVIIRIPIMILNATKVTYKKTNRY